MKKSKPFYLLICICTFIMAIGQENADARSTSFPFKNGGYDTARIFKAMAKAPRGEPVTIGVIGGSITQGYAASTEANRWANLVESW